MSGEELQQRLHRFNITMKANDDIYRGLARKFMVSDCTLWILYTLREMDTALTQKEICSIIYLPRQTVNSALKKMEKDGYIRLLTGKDKRSKMVCLTDTGKKLAAETVDKVIEAEKEALSGFSGKELEDFLGTFRRYNEKLNELIKRA